MGILARLLHRTSSPTTRAAAEAPVCPHTALLPRWDTLEDMGHDERATSFHCDVCGEEFTPAEAHLLRVSETGRLRGSDQPPSPN